MRVFLTAQLCGLILLVCLMTADRLFGVVTLFGVATFKVALLAVTVMIVATCLCMLYALWSKTL